MTRNPATFSLAMTYAPATKRPALEALFALDDTLAGILRTTREPLVGQMRLTWWYEALGRLDSAPAPAEPVLAELQRVVLPCGVSGTMLATLTDGWEVLLEPELDAAAIARFAAGRGRRLFEFAGTLLGAGVEAGAGDDRIGIAGEGWALSDLALGISDAAIRAEVMARAVAQLDMALHGHWSSAARALSALALSARFDVSAAPPPSGPKRVARLAWHRLTGY